MSKAPSTQATRFLKQSGISYTEHLYRYEEHGGTAVSAQALGVAEHCVVKTLVMEDDRGVPLIILMHGDQEVSTRELARQIGVRSVRPCDPATAQRHSGYLVGGTSPFGTKKPLPIFAEASIFELDQIYINGGSRGFLVGLNPAVLAGALQIRGVTVAIT